MGPGVSETPVFRHRLEWSENQSIFAATEKTFEITEKQQVRRPKVISVTGRLGNFSSRVISPPAIRFVG